MQREPRLKLPQHLDFISYLPCICCGDNTSTEAAHVSMTDHRIAKRYRGLGEKSHDYFTVPMCGKHHREQHAAGDERRFWEKRKIDPVLTALALYACSGNVEKGEQIVAAARCHRE
jgi:hypothetical protein